VEGDARLREPVAMKILLVEDDELIAEPLVQALIEHRYVVDRAIEGESAWELIESFTYDLILLDVGLPKLDGVSLCRQLRAQGNQVLVLLLTARDGSVDRTEGLDAGADDYVVKPFDIQELLARMRALLRRGSAALPPLLKWYDLWLNPSTCEVTWQHQPIRLTPKEYGLLNLFLRNRQRIYSCSALMDHLWSFEEPPSEDTIRSHLKGLRQKLKAAGVPEDPIETIYGLGYRLKAAPLETDAEPLSGSKAEASPLQLGKADTAPRPEAPALLTGASQLLQTGSSAHVQLALPEAEIDLKLQAVWQEVRPKLHQRISSLEQAAARLTQGKLSKKLRQEAERNAHKLAGSLGMFGSDLGSSLAKEIEAVLQPGKRLTTDRVLQLAQWIHLLQAELERLDTQHTTDATPEALEHPPALKQPIEARVLVIDDDAQVLTALKHLLEPWGFEMFALEDARQYANAVIEAAPDLIVLDVDMPHLDGIQLCQILRSDPQSSGLPILILTARTDAATMHQMFAAGADDYVNKPIVGPELLTRILNRLERSRLLRNLADMDALTGIANRRKSTQDLNRFLSLAQRYQQPFSLAILDLDHFKQINDRHGHATGDYVLHQLGELLQTSFRGEDIVGRWGGEEFVIGMYGATQPAALQRLEDIRKVFQARTFHRDRGGAFAVTFSVGVAQYPQDGTDLQTLYHMADLALYRAKTAGKSQPMAPSNLHQPSTQP
jgi:diguanylate cyclase (GGDEF)-like protein